MKIILNGVGIYDGEYPLASGELDQLTNREIHEIKQVSGYTPVEYNDALRRGDQDFWVALTLVALRRSGRHGVVNPDVIWDAPGSAIQVDFSDEVADADPPPQETPSGSGEPGTPSTRSGGPSRGVSELPQRASHAATGLHSSEMHAG